MNSWAVRLFVSETSGGRFMDDLKRYLEAQKRTHEVALRDLKNDTVSRSGSGLRGFPGSTGSIFRREEGQPDAGYPEKTEAAWVSGSLMEEISSFVEKNCEAEIIDEERETVYPCKLP